VTLSHPLPYQASETRQRGLFHGPLQGGVEPFAIARDRTHDTPCEDGRIISVRTEAAGTYGLTGRHTEHPMTRSLLLTPP
jgi:hypothetical protein